MTRQRNVHLIVLFFATVLCAKPLEPFEDYLVILVHGIHKNHKSEEIEIKCKSDADCEKRRNEIIARIREETGQDGDFDVDIERYLAVVPRYGNVTNPGKKTL